MNADCAAVMFPEARFCWSVCQAVCDFWTLLDAEMYCENPAVDKAATAMVHPLARDVDPIPHLSFVGQGRKGLRKRRQAGKPR